MTNWIGRTVSKVTIQKLLGRGGMAEVYLGIHSTLNRPVAVKILHGFLSGDESLLSRFSSEAQAVAGMRHPNIVQILDFDVADDQPYIVMEFLEGPSLSDYIQTLRQTNQQMSPETVTRLITFIAAALDYAHTRGVVHRDVKPSNVVLRSEAGKVDLSRPLQGDVQPILTDFGVARMANATIRTASGVIVGTPAYMSPEQVSGESVDSRSDIYSLGVMLYEMLSGRLPFSTDSETVASTLIKHITEDPAPLVEVSPEVQTVVLRALAKDRNMRYQTATELAVDLCDSFGLPFIPTPETTPVPRRTTPVSAKVPRGAKASARPRSQSRWRWWALLALPIAAILGVILVQMLWGGDDNPAGTERVGMLHFEDGEGDVDQVVLSVQNMPQLPTDQKYEVWLLGDETRQSVGDLALTEDGVGQLVFAASEGANLLALYGAMEITVEPEPDGSPLPSGDVVYQGQVPRGVLTHVRHLLVRFGNAPGEIGLTIGVKRHAAVILQAADSLSRAAQSGDQAGMRLHAETLVNLIEGPGGEHYGDLDGDDTVTDGGDGFGLLPSAQSTGYIQGSIEHANYAAGTDDATETVIEQAARLEVAGQNLGQWAAQLRDTALMILELDDGDDATALADELTKLAGFFAEGTDTNDDGLIEALPGEGGAETLYFHALSMADIEVVSNPDN